MPFHPSLCSHSITSAKKRGQTFMHTPTRLRNGIKLHRARISVLIHAIFAEGCHYVRAKNYYENSSGTQISTDISRETLLVCCKLPLALRQFSPELLTQKYQIFTTDATLATYPYFFYSTHAYYMFYPYLR